MQAFSAQNARHANREGGLCKAGDILKQQHGDLLVSRHKLRQADFPRRCGLRGPRGDAGR
jgi:hypothetical protein